MSLDGGTTLAAMSSYPGSALRYAVEAAPFSNGVTHKLGKNPGTYPFQLSHVVSQANKSGVIGNEDEVWWSATVLTQQQICRDRQCMSDMARCGHARLQPLW